LTLEHGADFGLRSILFLLGALAGVDASAKVKSYEGPFGVGYMVATLAVRGVDFGLTDVARQALGHYFRTGEMMAVMGEVPEVWRRRAGAFVSLHGADGGLRGCIGTISPVHENVAAEVAANVVLAATQDERFEPVRAEELDDLTISVDVLGEAEMTDMAGLDPRKYGVIVTARDGRRGVLLPDLVGVDTAAEQVAICREKGEIGADEAVGIWRFVVERHEE
jgi:AmmeMemoRadiSam system protein A